MRMGLLALMVGSSGVAVARTVTHTIIAVVLVIVCETSVATRVVPKRHAKPPGGGRNTLHRHGKRNRQQNNYSEKPEVHVNHFNHGLRHGRPIPCEVPRIRSDIRQCAWFFPSTPGVLE
jgi:hypothetical protein